jgi:hypothetical protein
MFVISQFILHKSKLCNFDNISTYAIASGLVVYASIYLYLLFYNNDYLSLFNKFIIYIIGIDLLLSTFYFFNTSKTHQNMIDTDMFEKIDTTMQPIELIDSESEVENEEDSDFEVNTEDDCDENMLPEIINYEDTQEYTQTQESLEDNQELQITQETQDQEQESQQYTQNQEQELHQDTPSLEITQEELDTILQNQQVQEIDNLELSSETVVKKRRGRKPNHLKMQIQ